MTTDKSSPPSISVIMAVYNTVSYLPEAVQSIINQSFDQFELITIDDGSTDGSAQLLDELAKKDNRIRVIHQKNQGVGAATNTGIKAAAGLYIALMDSDDLALPNRLEIQKNFLDAHLDIAGVGGQMLDIDAENKILGLDFQPIQPEIVSCCNHAFFSLTHSTTMVRRSAFEAIGMYLEDRNCLAPDYDVFTRMQAAGFRFANVAQVVHKWRKNPHGLTYGSAFAQTQSSHAIRQWGFAKLMETNPVQAYQASRNLLMSFPEGTWFDEKLRQLLPEEDRSYLINALKNSSQSEVYFSTLEYLILDWFEGRLTEVSPLVTALKANGLTWFALQLAIRYGLADAEEIFIVDSPMRPFPSTSISILAPFKEVDTDLFSRIENIRQICPDAEIVAFPLAPDSETCSFADMPGVKFISSSVEISNWQAAFNIASGHFLAYLEPHFRFDPESFMNVVNKLNEGVVLVYTPSERYFLEALDENSLPYQDPTPHPRWTSETLLGQNRVVLSGFCHRRELFESVIPPLSECGDRFSLALALSLAHQYDMVVIPGQIREYVPGISFENRILSSFKENMITWYFNSGLGTLPEVSVWKNLDEIKTQMIAKSINRGWQTRQFRVHPFNTENLAWFFATKVKHPLSYSIFRNLLIFRSQSIQEILKYTHSRRQMLQYWFYAQFRLICSRFFKLFTKKP